MGLERNTYRQYFATKEDADNVLEALRQLDERYDDPIVLADLLDICGKRPFYIDSLRGIDVEHAYVERITRYTDYSEVTQYAVNVRVYSI